MSSLNSMGTFLCACCTRGMEGCRNMVDVLGICQL